VVEGAGICVCGVVHWGRERVPIIVTAWRRVAGALVAERELVAY
jgi:hypothetical protein